MYSDPSDEEDADSDQEDAVTRHEFGDEIRPSVAVVEAVAAATGRDPFDVPPLYTVVDPDALDDLFSSRHDGTPRTAGKITFELAGRTVSVSGRGEVIVHQRDPATTGSEPFSASGSV